MIRIAIISISILLVNWATAQQDINASIRHGGLVRDYTIHLPTGYNGNINSYPLVLNLHGYGSNRHQQALVSEMNDVADTAAFIVVYPDGTFDLTGKRYWNANYNNVLDDIGFLNTLVDSLVVNYAINSNRVYNTGYSNGAIMSHTLACESTNKFAAVASVAGTMAIGQQSSCSPSRAIPVLHMHGTSDVIVQYEGNSLLIAVDSLISHWVNLNGLDSTPTTTTIPNIDTTDNCTAVSYEYGLSTNTPVQLIKITGGRHTWAGSTIQQGFGTSGDFEASSVIWNFFNRHSLPTAVTKVAFANNLVKQFYSPYAGRLSWQSDLVDYQVQLFNTLGQPLAQINGHAGSNDWQLPHLPTGIYIAVFQTANTQQSIKFTISN